jgi:hypothetical protein
MLLILFGPLARIVLFRMHVVVVLVKEAMSVLFVFDGAYVLVAYSKLNTLFGLRHVMFGCSIMILWHRPRILRSLGVRREFGFIHVVNFLAEARGWRRREERKGFKQMAGNKTEPNSVIIVPSWSWIIHTMLSQISAR